MNFNFPRKLRAAAAVLSLCALLACGCAKQAEPVITPTETLVSYQGKTYVPRENITTLLVMGLDKFERPISDRGYTNHLQADFLALLVMDQQAGTMELLHLNRDTMTEIRRLGVGGGVSGKFQGQLALAHTYGSGGSDSCLNAVKAVSTLLGGAKIDHYMTLTMDAVAAINDLVDGVTVTVLDDMTAVDPALVKGQEVTLKGEQALLYVRTRMGLADSSNLTRMERQRQYIAALFEKIMDKQRSDENFLANALLKVSDAFVSDYTVNQLDALADQMEGSTLAPIYTLKGEAKVGEEFMEFYVDPDSLQKTILELFYQPVP